MSNEYKDWIIDQASDYLLDNSLLTRIEYQSAFSDGYIIAGLGSDWNKHIFFVWLDDDYGWAYKEIVV